MRQAYCTVESKSNQVKLTKGFLLLVIILFVSLLTSCANEIPTSHFDETSSNFISQPSTTLSSQPMQTLNATYFPLPAFSGSINVMQWSPDSSTLATSDANYLLEFWNRQGRMLKAVRHQSIRVNKIQWISNGDIILYYDNNNYPSQLWSETGQLLSDLPISENFINFPKQQLFALESLDYSFTIYSDSGKMIVRIPNQNNCSSILLSPDSNLLTLYGNCEIGQLWNINGQLITNFTGAEQTNFVKTSDKLLVTNYYTDNSIDLFDSQGHSKLVLPHFLSQSPNGSVILTTSENNDLLFWNADGEKILDINAHKDRIKQAVWSSDSQRFVTTSLDGKTILWSKDGKILGTVPNYNYDLNQVLWSPNDQYFALVLADNSVQIWSKGGEKIAATSKFSNSVRTLAWSPDGKLLLAQTDFFFQLLWSVDKGLIPPNSFLQYSWSSKGDKVALVEMPPNNGVEIWDTRGQKFGTSITEDSPNINWLENTDMLEIIKEDKIDLFDSKGILVNSVPTNENLNNPVSPDGKYFVVPQGSNNYELKDLNNHLISQFNAIQDGTTLHWFNGSNYFIVESDDGSSYELLNNRGQSLAAVQRRGQITWSPDKSFVLTTNEDTKITELWDETGKLISTLPVSYNYYWSPNSKLIEFVDSIGNLQIFDNTGRTLYKYLLPSLINQVRWINSGSVLALSLNNNEVQFVSNTGALIGKVSDGVKFKDIDNVDLTHYSFSTDSSTLVYLTYYMSTGNLYIRSSTGELLKTIPKIIDASEGYNFFRNTDNYNDAINNNQMFYIALNDQNVLEIFDVKGDFQFTFIDQNLDTIKLWQWSSDENSLALVNLNGDTNIWHSQSNSEYDIPHLVYSPVDLSWSSDDSKIVTIDNKGTLNVYSTSGETTNLAPCLSIENGRSISDISFSPHSMYFSDILYSSKIVNIYDKNCNSITTFPLTDGNYSIDANSIADIQWLEDDKRLLVNLSGTNNYVLRNIDGDQLAQAPYNHEDLSNNTVYFSENEGISFLDSDGQKIITLPDSYDSSLFQNTPDKSLLVISSPQNLYFIDTAVTSLVQSISSEEGSTTNQVRWSSDGNILASGNEYGDLTLWDTQKKQLITFTKADTNSKSVSCLAWSPDSNVLATGTWSGVLKFWSRQGTAITTNDLGTGVTKMVWSPDNSILVTILADGSVKFWNKQGQSLSLFNQLPKFISDFEWSPDGQIIATATDNAIQFWDASGTPLSSPITLPTKLTVMKWFYDSKSLVFATIDGKIQVWDKLVKKIQQIGNFEVPVTALDLSFDNQILAANLEDYRIKFWKNETLLGSGNDQKLTQLVQTLLWSPDNKYLVGGSIMGNIEVWGQSGNFLSEIKTQLPSVNSIDWSPDSKTLAIGGSNIPLVLLTDISDLVAH